MLYVSMPMLVEQTGLLEIDKRTVIDKVVYLRQGETMYMRDKAE